MPRRIFPVPEIILEDRVSITGTDEHSGSMDNESRIMRVPLIDTPACRHIRAHEMAHAKYSPKRPDAPVGIHRMTLQRVEDMRMNVLCRAQGLNEAMDAPIITDPSIWDRLLTDKRSILTAGISTFNTGDWPEFVRKTACDDEEFIQSVYSALQDDPTFENTIRQAELVEKYLRGEVEPPPAESDDSGDKSGDESGDESEDSESSDSDESSKDDSDDDTSDDSSDGDDSDSDDESDSDGSSDGDSDSDDASMPDEPIPGADGTETEPVDLTGDILDELTDKLIEDEVKKMSMTPFERGIERLEWARDRYSIERDAKIVPIKITVQKMPKRLPPNKFKSRAKVPADMGMVPKHMHRYCTDKAIFAGRGRKRSRGGTILIDASGSMAIYEDQIDEIMGEVPLGTIASYSGQYAHQGDLYVIAKNGNRAVKDLRPPGLMNEVDVPALEWMVKQEGPYFWVCDGIVTGKNDSPGRNIFDKCQEIAERHGIIMVPNLKALVKLIQTGKY